MYCMHSWLSVDTAAQRVLCIYLTSFASIVSKLQKLLQLNASIAMIALLLISSKRRQCITFLLLSNLYSGRIHYRRNRFVCLFCRTAALVLSLSSDRVTHESQRRLCEVLSFINMMKNYFFLLAFMTQGMSDIFQSITSLRKCSSFESAQIALYLIHFYDNRIVSFHISIFLYSGDSVRGIFHMMILSFTATENKYSSTLSVHTYLNSVVPA